MGWAKYTEDINEVVFERMMLLSQRAADVELNIANNFEKMEFIESSSQNMEYEEAYSDIKIMCRDCGKKFVFSAKSQKYYDEQGWDSPKRCKHCRDFRNTAYLMRASH